MPETLKEWALYYADVGLAVFPLRARDKRPATENGCKAATTNKQQISDWWDKHPGSNIGIATGSVSGGVLVIDLDVDENKGVNGYEVMKEWQQENGELPESWQSVTGRGGYHLFYRDTAVRQNHVGLYDGVDIRGEGGYIVAPPSIHPNGRKYEWEQEPGAYELAQVNDRIVKFLNGPVLEEGEKRSFKMSDIIPEGERVSTMVRLIGSLKAKGLDNDAIRAAVRAENEKKCIPPLTDQELEKEVFPALKMDWRATAPYNKAVCDNGVARPLKEFKPIKAVTAAELDKMDTPPIEWLVNEILPIGLSMIGAPSKYYKSYMSLGLCAAICTGEKFLNFATQKHGCHYLDLESTKRRPKSRLNQIFGPANPKLNNLYIITGDDEIGRIGDGFESQIEYQLKEHSDIKLIIVDVFQMIRKPAKRNQNGYDRDYDDFKVLKHIADAHSIGLMLIHHTRKMRDPSDVFNELSGSVGVMGALDCAWVITKDDRYSEEGTLHVTGRDMDAQKLKIKFNKKIFQWEYVGTEEDIETQRLFFEYDQSPITDTIRKLVKQGGGHWEGSASDIKEASKYLSSEIYDDAKRVGNFNNKFESFFMGVDGIRYDVLILTPKSKTSVRDIPLNNLIKGILRLQKEKMTAVYGEQSLADRIFCGGYGGIITPANVSINIDLVLKRLRDKGIQMEHFSHHAFRDTFATRYIEAGGNMQTLKQILGHASLAMTMDLYAHVLPSTKKAEMEQIQSIFSGWQVNDLPLFWFEGRENRIKYMDWGKKWGKRKMRAEKPLYLRQTIQDLRKHLDLFCFGVLIYGKRIFIIRNT